MVDYSRQLLGFYNTPLAPWIRQVEPLLQSRFSSVRFGELPKWEQALASLPGKTPDLVDLSSDAIRLGSSSQLSQEESEECRNNLMVLSPWRKGPFRFFDIDIETEWRSDWKWDRFCHDLPDLTDKTVLDIGCGSGYHLLRAAGAGAGLALGIEPLVKYIYQFAAVQKYSRLSDAMILPLGIEEVPDDLSCFDVVFSMGVLYHRRSPLDHLKKVLLLLNPGGTAVIESLVIPGTERDVLLPRDRYARMRNTWFIPSAKALMLWMRRTGYESLRCIALTPTLEEEQHATDWMKFWSLKDFLDPSDPSKTVEGYPAPVRIVILGNRPK